MVSRSSKKHLADTFRLVPFHFAETGRGLKTKKSIAPGRTIISIPQCLLVTPRYILDSHIGYLVKGWKTKFTPHQLLSLFLLVERNRGSNSEWQPFLNSLPAAYSLPHYFSTEEIHFLPQDVFLTAQKMIQGAQAAHKQVLQFCSFHWKKAECWASWENFRWAWCSVSSRAVFLEAEAGTEEYLDLSKKEEISMALCPYLDLVNHSTTAKVCAGFNKEIGCYQITTLDSYRPHQQVFICYGAHDNVTLFLYYGFTLPKNLHSKVSFSLDDMSVLKDAFQLKCWEHKLAVLRRHELHRGLNCTLDGLSWNLQSALNILSMNWEQLQHSERAVTGGKLPEDVETLTKHMAQYFLSHFLARSRLALATFPAVGDLSSLHRSIGRRLVSDDVDILVAVSKDHG